MAKKPKNPKYNVEPVSTKQPKIASSPPDFYSQRPSWRVSKLEFANPFGWHELDKAQIEAILNKLKDFESMTWREILLDAKKQNHTVSINQLGSTARRRLQVIQLDDLDELTSLRLSGKQRIWGILNQGTLNLLWWDPNHQVYPVQKKNT